MTKIERGSAVMELETVVQIVQYFYYQGPGFWVPVQFSIRLSA